MEEFNFETFTNLMRHRGIDYAIKYRDKFKQSKNIVEDTEQTQEWVQEETQITREEIKEKLKTAWVEFYKSYKTDKLLELCINNNLL